MQDRVIDVGFAAQSTPGPDMIPLTKDKMVAVLPKGHVLGDNDIVSIGSLVDYPFIMSTGGCEPLIEESFGRSQCRPSIKFAVRDMDTILNMVGEGLGITIVPDLSLPDTTPHILVKNLQPTMWRYLGLRCPFINEATSATPLWRLPNLYFMGNGLYHERIGEPYPERLVLSRDMHPQISQVAVAGKRTACFGLPFR